MRRHGGYSRHAAPRGFRLRRPRPLPYQPLAYWRMYGLTKPNQYVAAEYAWQQGLDALKRQWCPARDRHWFMRPAARIQRGRVYERVCMAIERRLRKQNVARGPHPVVVYTDERAAMRGVLHV